MEFTNARLLESAGNVADIPGGLGSLVIGAGPKLCVVSLSRHHLGVVQPSSIPRITTPVAVFLPGCWSARCRVVRLLNQSKQRTVGKPGTVNFTFI